MRPDLRGGVQHQRVANQLAKALLINTETGTDYPVRYNPNEFTLEQAAQFTSANTPRGWLRLDANTVRGEQHLYLQQPGSGTSYLIGKIQIEQLIATRRRQLGDAFTFKQFMDAFNAVGLIPASLVAWELTGEAPSAIRTGAP